MLVKTLFFTLALSAVGLAQEIDDNDVPQQCRAVCTSVVALARSCDQQHDRNDNDNDRAELDCICQAQNASTQIPICEACVAQFDIDDDLDDTPRDNDINDLLRSCNFSTTTFNPSATATSLSPVSAASVSGSQSAATGSSSSPTGNSVAPASTGTTATNPVATSTSGSAPLEQSTNAAPMPTMAAAGVLAGVLGFAAGLL